MKAKVMTTPEINPSGVFNLFNKFDIEVKLEPVEHRYFDQFDNEYMSVSKTYGIYKSFDREAKSLEKAGGDLIKQAALLDQWDAKRDSSAEFGTRYHDGQERFHKQGIVLPEDQEFRKLFEAVESMLFAYKKQKLEFTIASLEKMVAGTADRVCERPIFGRKYSGPRIIDIFDYKTNQAKGIQFKNDFGSYMHKPFTHLEDCNYMHYSLQLSLYGLMLEREYDVKVGRLAIIDVSNMKFPVMVPVAYLRNEAEYILNAA